MWKVVVSILLFLGGVNGNAWNSTPKEFELDYLHLIEAKIRLLNNWSEVLEKSIYSYIPYHEENALIKEPMWMFNLYLKIIEKYKKYDVFYARISDLEKCNLFLIKDNTVFLYTPYLKIPGSEKKIYDSGELKYLIEEVENQLFKEKNPQKVLELVSQLHALKNTVCEVDFSSKRLPPEITQSIIKIMQTFKSLQSTDKTLNGYDLEALYDYMWDGEVHGLMFYGLNSSLFGASIQSLTVPGSPGICIGRMFNNLSSYIKSNPANEQSELDDLKMEIKELPFLRDCY